jgi:integrase/recombinase XerD
MPPARPRVRQTFVPYVYTRAELHALLQATKQNDSPRRRIDRQTLRAFILVLYGTGARAGEILGLKSADVDLKADLMTIRAGSSSRSRQIPIGADLHDVIGKYQVWRTRKNFQSPCLFVTKADAVILNRSANQNFKRLRESAGVLRHDGGSCQPRMNDLRCTFAVHRITSWIRNGADLNRMLPALAAYMGQVGLGSTEQYLSLTPERFRKWAGIKLRGRKKRFLRAPST